MPERKFEFSHLLIDYDSPLRADLINFARGGRLLEAPDQEQEVISPSKVTLTECDHRIFPFECNVFEVDANDLSWSVVATSGDASKYGVESGWVCFDTGQSVAEKRGLIDCGAKGPVLAIVTNKKASAEHGVPTRGSILSYGSSGYASGSFVIRATITSSTPGFEKYAGSFGEYTVVLENRLDIRLTTNTGSLFSTAPTLITVNTIGPDGLVHNASFKSKSCHAETSTGQVIPGSFDQYTNKYRLVQGNGSVLAGLPSGTSLTVSCEGTIGNQSAHATLVETKN